MEPSQLNKAILFYYDSAGNINFQGGRDVYTRTIGGTNTGQRTYTLPDKSGTFAMLSDIPFVPTGTSGGIQLLAKITANMNTTADQLITLTGGTFFFITDILILNCSVHLTTAKAAQLNTGPGKTGLQQFNTINLGGDLGTVMLDSTSVLSGQTLSLMYPPGTYSQSGTTIYFSLGTPQGSAATADVYIYGYILI